MYQHFFRIDELRMSDTDEDSDVHSDPDTASDTDNENDPVTDEDLDKPEFNNWVRGSKSLEYLQQGLAPFVDREIAIKHNSLIIGLNATPHAYAICNCTYDNILPDHTGGQCISRRKNQKQCPCNRPGVHRRRTCPNGVCSKLYDLILLEHRYNEPLWANSTIPDWEANAWSVAKCYMTTKCHTSSAQSTDAAGLLSIITNATFFQQKVTCVIVPPNDVFSQVILLMETKGQYKTELYKIWKYSK